MNLSEPYPFDEEHCSQEIQDLLKEARTLLSPKHLILRLDENLPMDLDVHAYEDEEENCIILIRSNTMNEVTLSHEILHLLVKPIVPQLIRVVKFDLVGIIGTELQGYLEHYWIRAEQERRGILTSEIEQSLFPNLLGFLGSDYEELGRNIQKIVFLNNLILSYPTILEKHRVDLTRRNTQSLKWAERIMAHYPQQTLTDPSVARKCIIDALTEWTAIFRECGLSPDLLRYLITVIPVFTEAQLILPAKWVLGFIPEAISADQTGEISSVLYMLKDGQGCALLTLQESERDLLFHHYNTMILKQFLEAVPIPWLAGA
ncbi:hypothetical protein [Desulfitobacterium sp.]|uniref:hypothetical protein n=1 Tax=Desulfitobacterium sp. TaxID=49981 RepID=UPI002B21215B|nr:hypothetical protein [Desulfitobacterium sp.]MEA4902191.1 hypothetical protein [Desulfitobacterium sp.]